MRFYKCEMDGIRFRQDCSNSERFDTHFETVIMAVDMYAAEQGGFREFERRYEHDGWKVGIYRSIVRLA